MKRNRILSLLGIAVIFIAGCNKEMDITLTNVNDGNLKITVTTASGNPIADHQIDLYDYNSLLEDTKTDENGVAEFKNILMGSYYINIKKAVDGGVEYNVSQIVQVINGVTKEYEIIPSDYSGSISITVVDYSTGDPISGISVDIFRSEDIEGTEFTDLRSISFLRGQTNFRGVVNFEKIPFGEYGVLVYKNADDYDYSNYFFSINSKGQERKGTFVFYETSAWDW